MRDYSPFGVTLDGRSFNATSYKYAFNGQEKDDEVKGAGNSYSYEYRFEDPRLGRFLSLDPLVKEFPSNSGYQFAGNSPILYIDVHGLFKMSKRDQRKYPQLANMLMNMEDVVKSDPGLYDAYKKNVGLSDEQATNMLRWGQGPKVRVGKMSGALAITKNSKSTKLNKKMVNMVEGKEAHSYDKEGMVLVLYATVLHESQHNAEFLLNSTKFEPYDPNTIKYEAGFSFEATGLGFISFPSKDMAPLGEVADKALDAGEAAKLYNEKLTNILGIKTETVQVEVPLEPSLGNKRGDASYTETFETQENRTLSKELGVDTQVQKSKTP